ncbi:MAG: hypothetical protein ACO1RX_03455 [Candidatus Sericytochromatia bacterium]
MIHVIAAEWIRLGQPRVCSIMLGSVGSFAILSTLMTLTLVLRNGSVRGFENVLLRAGDFTSSAGWSLLIERQVMILGLAAASLAAAQCASDYTYGTIRMVGIREPRRGLWLTGKLLALMSVIILSVLTASACTGLTAWLMQNSQLQFSAWMSSVGWAFSLQAMFNLSLAAVGYGLMGAILGMVLRSSLMAISLAAGYALFEGVFAGLFAHVFKYFPGQTLSALAQGGTLNLSYSEALLWAGVYVSMSVCFGIRYFIRSDITA